MANREPLTITKYAVHIGVSFAERRYAVALTPTDFTMNSERTGRSTEDGDGRRRHGPAGGDCNADTGADRTPTADLQPKKRGRFAANMAAYLHGPLPDNVTKKTKNATRYRRQKHADRYFKTLSQFHCRKSGRLESQNAYQLIPKSQPPLQPSSSNTDTRNPDFTAKNTRAGILNRLPIPSGETSKRP
ncbi:Hypothetical protein CINCED_3A020542 [Cinara cedri]|uniref:Uncharacterized protein n=1 Tax=Cinara cedri TaxID=506608 RepID=A0A5E4MMH6_9HEMI|nr:Hypothetical protein CINCED_3A020542 [Cinara cedri]